MLIFFVPRTKKVMIKIELIIINKLELVNYKDSTVLLLNNSIVYDNKKLFYYKLNLSLTNDDFIFNKERFNNCINYIYIKN